MKNKTKFIEQNNFDKLLDATKDVGFSRAIAFLRGEQINNLIVWLKKQLSKYENKVTIKYCYFSGIIIIKTCDEIEYGKIYNYIIENNIKGKIPNQFEGLDFVLVTK